MRAAIDTDLPHIAVNISALSVLLCVMNRCWNGLWVGEVESIVVTSLPTQVWVQYLVVSCKTYCGNNNNIYRGLSFFFCYSGPGASSPSPSEGKDSKMLKLEPKDSPTSSTSQGIQSPKEALQAIADLEAGSKLPDEATGYSSIPGSPTGSIPLDDSSDLKMTVYSPSQEEFTMPTIANEAQTSTSITTPAVSDVQGAKQYISDSEYSVSTNSDQPGNYYSQLTSVSRGYSFSQSSISPSPLMSPSTYPAGFNTQPFHAGSAEAMMTAGTAMYPSTACMSPSAYMSPYTGKQYTWPTTPSGMTYPTAFGMNSHEIGYTAATYQPHYSQMTRMPGYPAGYPFPSQVPPTSSPTC